LALAAKPDKANWLNLLHANYAVGRF